MERYRQRHGTTAAAARSTLILSLFIMATAQERNFEKSDIAPTSFVENNWSALIDNMLKSTSQPQIFPTPPQKNYFSKIGTVEPTRDWIHLHVTYNLTSLRHFAETPCKCLDTAQKFEDMKSVHDVRHKRTAIYIYHAKRNFERQCQSSQSLIAKFNKLIEHATHYSNAPGFSDKRQQRGVPVLLWTAVSAAVGPTGFSLAKYILQNVSKASFIFNIASTLMSIVSLGTYLITGRGNTMTDSSLHDWDAFDMEAKLRLCQEDSNKFFRYMHEFNDGLFQLLKHEYPSHFVHPSEILAELPVMRQALQEKNIRLLLDNPADIAACPSSFVVHDAKLHMFIHVPISHAPKLTAYKYIPTPTIYTVSNTTTLATVTHYNSILALTDDMQTFVELPDLSDCNELQATRFLCPNTPVLHHNPDGSCLYALFNSHTNNTYNYCTLNHFNRKYFATELAPTRFFLYTQQPDKASIQCSAAKNLRLNQPFHAQTALAPTKSHTLPLHYTSSVIQLPAHCHLQIFNLSLYPASTHKTDVILAKSAFTSNDAKFFQMTQVFEGDTERLDTPKPMSKFDFVKRYAPHIIAAVCLIITLLLSICIISIPLFCVKRRHGRFVIKQPLRNLLLALHSRPGPLAPLAQPRGATANPDHHLVNSPIPLVSPARTPPTIVHTPATPLVERRQELQPAPPQSPSLHHAAANGAIPKRDGQYPILPAALTPAAGGDRDRMI